MNITYVQIQMSLKICDSRLLYILHRNISTMGIVGQTLTKLYIYIYFFIIFYNVMLSILYNGILTSFHKLSSIYMRCGVVN